MACPELPTPVYELLARYDRDRFLPGVEAIPPERGHAAGDQPALRRGFMVGLNHEMNRELLWREYPTDQRGTPLRHFWDWFDGGADIEPIHELGRGARARAARRAAARAARSCCSSAASCCAATRTPSSTPGAPPAATSRTRPDRPTSAGRCSAGASTPTSPSSGFDLTEDGARGRRLVLRAPGAADRAALRVRRRGAAAVTPRRWSDATWQEAGTAAGDHLVIAGNRLGLAPRDGVAFATNAGNLAAATLQKPVRVAVSSSRLFSPG